jgi:hypothetical protein
LKNAFTDDDKKKVIELLNFLAERAIFNGWKTEDTVRHFKLLAHMQQVILPKIEAHIFEMGEVVQAAKPEADEG